MPGRPKTRRKNQHKELARTTPKPDLTETRLDPKRQYLADIYAEKYTTFDALRRAMIANGIVEHGINPYDVIQRAIDDTATDYLLLRRRIDKDTHGDPTQLVEHPLYEYMEHMREAMVRYSTFAMQYDIQRRQIRLSETRVALLANTLRQALPALGLTPDQIKEVPRLLIDTIKQNEPKSPNPRSPIHPGLDPIKAEAMAEILNNEADIEITDADEVNGNAPSA